MRNLTIKRTKSIVGCAFKMKVYVEDATSGEITINKIPCRKLGTLKNGEEATFQIDNDETRVYVIADTVSKEFCNDFYIVPAGDEDVSLSGKNHFSPSTGNAFLFDGVEHNEDDLQIKNDEIMKLRRANKRRGRIILISSFVLGIIIGVLSVVLSDPEPKTFVSSEGFTITLTDEFSERDHEGFTDCYISSDVSVMVFNEGFYEYSDISEYTISEYGYMFLNANELTSSRLEETDGLTHFEYNVTADSGKDYGYFGVIFKDTDCFWVVQFSTYLKDMDEYRPQFMEWAKSINFSKEVAV